MMRGRVTVIWNLSRQQILLTNIFSVSFFDIPYSEYCNEKIPILPWLNNDSRRVCEVLLYSDSQGRRESIHACHGHRLACD